MTETDAQSLNPEAAAAFAAEQSRNYANLIQKVREYISFCTNPVVTNYKAALLLHYAEHGSEGAYVGRVANAIQELGYTWQPVVPAPEKNLNDVRFLLQRDTGLVIPLNFTTTSIQARKIRKRYSEKYGKTPVEGGIPQFKIGLLQVVNESEVASDEMIKRKILQLADFTLPMAIPEPLAGTKEVNDQEINGFLSYLWRDWAASEKARSPMSVSQLHKLVREYTRLMTSQQVSLEAKIKIVTFEEDPNRNNTYELLYSELLELMKNAGQLYDWFPVPAYSQLDQAKVDFIVVLNSGMLLPVQVTSRSTLVGAKIRLIKRYFSLRETDLLPITIVTMINETKNNELFSLEILQEFMVSIMATAQTIQP